MTLEELVEAVNGLATELMPLRPLGSQDGLDGRTVRYYGTRGLIPRPSAYTGGRARYGASHLLRLLLIRKLQGEHQTLKAIERALSSLGDAEVLARLLDEAAAPVPGPAAPSAPTGTPLTLTPGGTVCVPEHVLMDPELRRELARNLRALAAWLDPAAADQDGGAPR